MINMIIRYFMVNTVMFNAGLRIGSRLGFATSFYALI
ncbi:Uncharacterised protein [Vibrio cholerae]|nr:Uncharacterised protein [Vibrio cholerae]